MESKMKKLLSIILVAALALSLTVAAIWDQPAQALTADEITTAQTAAATELAAGQARADKAWEALQKLPTPEEVKAGTETLPDTCPYCDESVTWSIVEGDENGETTTAYSNAHVYLMGDVTFTFADAKDANGKDVSAFITVSSGNPRCVFTNGYDITATAKPVFFLGNAEGNIIAWSRESRTQGGSVIKGHRNDNVYRGSTVFANGGTANGYLHLFGGTYEKYDSASKTSVLSDHDNSGKFYMYEGTTINAGTVGSAVYLNGTMNYAEVRFNMYGGTINGGAGKAAVTVESSSAKASSKANPSENPNLYVSFNMYGGAINGGAGQAALESIDGNNGKDCLINIYNGTINGNTANNSPAVRLSAAKTDFKMYGGTINAKSGNMAGPAIRTEVASKITIAGGNVNGTTTSSSYGGGAIYINAAATLNINGGTISGGVANVGGNISLDGGAIATMTGGEITGGTSTTTGGNIYISGNASLIMEDGTISGGNATTAGGNIYTKGTVNATGGKILNGTAGTNGGNICMTGCTVTLGEGVTVDNGWAKNTNAAGQGGGNIYMRDGKPTLNTAATITNGKVDGYKAAGGNINMGSGCTLNVTGGVIAHGVVEYKGDGNCWGGNIRSYGDATTYVNISGGAIYGGTSPQGAANVGIQNKENVTISGGFFGPLTLSKSLTSLKLEGNIQCAPQKFEDKTYASYISIGYDSEAKVGSEADISELDSASYIRVSGGSDGAFTVANEKAAELCKCFMTTNPDYCVVVVDNQLVYKAHSKTSITAKAATCEASGYAESGKYCATCKEYFNSAHTARVAEADMVIPALGHKYAGVVTAPTCDDAGYTTYTCANDAAHTYVADTVAKLGHNYVGAETKAATCTEEGVMTYTCQNDASHTYTEAIATIPHTEVIDEAVAPTCTETGLTEGKHCEVCGTVIVAQETVGVLGHSYAAETTPADCVNDGKTVYTCSACGHSYEEIIPAGHNIIHMAAVIPANCQETGHDEYWYCTGCEACFGDAEGSYQINPAWLYYTGDHVRAEDAIICAVVPCELCGEDSYGEACDRGDAPVCQNAPCVRCGETVYGWGCNYNTGDEEVQLPLCQPGTCVYCGTEYEKLYDCENGSWAPCAYDGECAYGCGKQYPATGEHQLDDPCAGGTCWLCWNTIEGAHTEEVVAGKAATCTETGLTDGSKCTVCGETTKAQEEIPALGHTAEVVPGYAATCTETGLTDGEKCTVCGEITKAQEEIPAGHKIEYKAAVVPANCQETGHDEYWYCAGCDAYFGDAEGSYQINPAWISYTGEHVRPEGSIVCAVVACELCGEDSYGEACVRPEDAPVCQDAACVNCGEIVWGWGCNYNTGDEEVQLPLCQPGTCVYCGTEYEKLYDCENGSWAPCAYDGECAYGCGKQYPATGVHMVDDPCAGGMCWLCWNTIEGAHTEEVVAGKAATCTETGLTDGSKCTVCDAILTAQEEIPALGHTAEVVPGYAATCTETGLTDGEKCTVCSEILTAQEEIPATGHSMQLISEKVPASGCLIFGKDAVYYCADCDKYYSDAEGKDEQDSDEPGMIFPDGHSFVFVEATEATCTEAGNIKHYKCTVCGGTYASNENEYETEEIDVTVASLGHTEGETVIENQVEATLNNAGSYDKVVYCSVCSEELSRETETVEQLTGAKASIKGYYYATFAEALAAVKEGETITLLAPITVAKGETLELNLNGFDVVYISDVMGEAMITNNGTLTVTGTGKLSYTYTGAADTAYTKGNYTIANNGSLTVDGATIENATAKLSHASYAITNGNGGQIVLESGLIVNETNYAVRMFGNGSLTVNGGEIRGTRAVWMQAPGSDTATAPSIALTVNGGKLTGTGETGYKLAVYSYSYGNSMKNISITVTDGEIEGDIALGGGKNKTESETVTVTGGTITNLYSYMADEVAAETVNVSGGTFLNPVYEAYCAEDYVPADNGDGTYGVVVDESVAKIGDVKYETLQAALAAAKTGETVVLLDNVDASGEVVLLMNGVKLDLNGKTLKVSYLITTTAESGIVDADGTGLVVMPKKNLTMVNPTCLPVWIEAEGGYRFSTVKAYISEQAKSAESLTLWYWFEECALDGALKSQLEKVDENDLKVVLRINYTYSDGSDAVLDIVVPNSVVVEYAQNSDAPHFATTIRGLNALGNATITVYATYGEIEIAGATYSYEAVTE